MVMGSITRVEVAMLQIDVNVAKEADVVVDVMRYPWWAMVSMLFLCPGEVRCHLDAFPQHSRMICLTPCAWNRHTLTPPRSFTSGMHVIHAGLTLKMHTRLSRALHIGTEQNIQRLHSSERTVVSQSREHKRYAQVLPAQRYT